MINRKIFCKSSPKIFKTAINTCTCLCPITDTAHTAHLENFSALTLLVGWQEGHPACKKTEWWGTGVVICLERGADLHMAS